MTTNHPKTKMAAAVAAVAASTSASAGLTSEETKFIERLKAVPDDASAKPPWDGVRQLGASVIPSLAQLLDGKDPEVARNARRALCEIVREAGRPGAQRATREVETELLKELSQGSRKSEVLWLLSEIATDRSVPAIADFLENAQLREDARCVLGRIPGKKATAALRSSYGRASREFKAALADALRARGEKVDAPPSMKMTPRKQTAVTPKASLRSP